MENTGFAQMYLEGSPKLARVYFLAPITPETHPRRTSALLSGLAREAVGRGARNLIAEANEGSPECAALRSAGFVVYARQQLYRMLSRSVLAKPSLSLNLCYSRDEIAAQRLYSNTVPALVRRFESDPSGAGGWCFLNSDDDDDMLVLLGVTMGAKGTWVQPYVHPEAEKSIGDVLAAFLCRGEIDPSKPVYVCVRSYHSWLRCALQETGFQLLGQQAVMVKRLTASVKKYRPVPAVVST